MRVRDSVPREPNVLANMWVGVRFMLSRGCRTASWFSAQYEEQGAQGREGGVPHGQILRTRLHRTEPSRRWLEHVGRAMVSSSSSGRPPSTAARFRASYSRFFAGVPRLALLLALAACGGESGAPPGGSATLTGTLAYVVTECRETNVGFFFNQKLLIRQGERDPITAVEIPDIGPLPLAGFCGSWARNRAGFTAADFGVFQRLAVSSDGAEVAFEITDAFSAVSLLLGGGFLTPDERGLFLMRADGTGLRRLGPPSRQPAFAPPYIYAGSSDLAFSPNGRMIAFPDLGPGPGSEETSQIFVLQLSSGSRTQVTQLPPASPAPTAWPLPGGAAFPVFLDDEIVGFYTEADADGLNPTGEDIFASVNADGSGGLARPPSPVALPGSQIDPRFVITGGRPAGLTLTVPGPPVNPVLPGWQTIWEIFFYDGGQNLLQLTNFHRVDSEPFGGDARQRVFFTASADPLGTNPSNNCQIFSVASLGGDLRQLTQFHETDHATTPCLFSGRRPYGCNILPLFPLARDADTGALLFRSTCDPFGTNPNGSQYFVMGADGAGLRQLTSTRGLVTEADGTVIGELPDPAAYSGFIR